MNAINHEGWAVGRTLRVTHVQCEPEYRWWQQPRRFFAWLTGGFYIPNWHATYTLEFIDREAKCCEVGK